MSWLLLTLVISMHGLNMKFIHSSFSALTAFVVCKYRGEFLRDSRVQLNLGMVSAELVRLHKVNGNGSGEMHDCFRYNGL